MSRSCGVVMELTGGVWVGDVGAPIGVGSGSEIGWSVLASGCWPASSIVGEAAESSEETVGVGGSV